MVNPRIPQDPNASERGAAAIVLLFALSIFSVLSMTVLRNSGLEAVLRTSDKPDVHVVLYAGRRRLASGHRAIESTDRRRVESGTDISAEIRAPGLVGGDLKGNSSQVGRMRCKSTQPAHLLRQRRQRLQRYSVGPAVNDAKLTPALERRSRRRPPNGNSSSPCRQLRSPTTSYWILIAPPTHRS
jgi:hypothetical protein